jgi:hypothetical protein
MSGAGGPYRELYFTAEGAEIDQNVNRPELAEAVRPKPCDLAAAHTRSTMTSLWFAVRRGVKQETASPTRSARAKMLP